MSPGGSAKDRAALAIILDAERRGVLRPGGTVVEGTAGNTGIGPTLVGNARGYRTVIVMVESRVPENLDGAAIDDAVRILDTEALEQVYGLLIHEGLSVGGSAGLNVAAAVQVARSLGPGHTVVTILYDGGPRYQSKLFNPAFLRAKGLPVPPWLTH